MQRVLFLFMSLEAARSGKGATFPMSPLGWLCQAVSRHEAAACLQAGESLMVKRVSNELGAYRIAS